jgi:hypothetical protein
MKRGKIIPVTGEKFIDLVISGCDFSGTSTQIKDLIDYLKSKNLVVRDLRGTEADAMFHAESFLPYNRIHTNLTEFSKDSRVHPFILQKVLNDINKIAVRNFRISSMVHNESTEYINPHSADAWVMEEPTKRGSGQTVRGFELYRSAFGDKPNNVAAALAHQAYRSEEFFRFRRILRAEEKITIRSRSEESCVYQIEDEEGRVPQGISQKDYLSLPGHKIAFGNPPTHIFLVVGPEDWGPNDYIQLRRQRTDNRILDDNEKGVGYQLIINRRYATNWIDNVYEEGCKLYGENPPKIIRFSIYDSREDIKKKMISELELILKQKTD